MRAHGHFLNVHSNKCYHKPIIDGASQITTRFQIDPIILEVFEIRRYFRFIFSKPVFYFGGFRSLLFPHYFSILGKRRLTFVFERMLKEKTRFYLANCSPVPKISGFQHYHLFLTAAYKGALKKGDRRRLLANIDGLFCVVKTAPMFGDSPFI